LYQHSYQDPSIKGRQPKQVSHSVASWIYDMLNFFWGYVDFFLNSQNNYQNLTFVKEYWFIVEPLIYNTSCQNGTSMSGIIGCSLNGSQYIKL
jgi:hypothetical protein